MELHVFFFGHKCSDFSNLAAVGDQTWFCADSFRHAAASSTQNKSASPVLAALSEVTLMDPTAFLPSAASSSVSLCLPGGRDVRTVTSIWLICSLWLTVANWLMFKIVGGDVIIFFTGWGTSLMICLSVVTHWAIFVSAIMSPSLSQAYTQTLFILTYRASGTRKHFLSHFLIKTIFKSKERSCSLVKTNK